MATRATRTKTYLLASMLLSDFSILSASVQAAQPEQPPAPLPGHAAALHPQQPDDGIYPDQASAKRGATRSFRISCVPYARQVSGIRVAGNAWQWWNNAAGIYARGDRPEAGSVLNFRPNGRMRLGHVAVVTQVVNSREVIVDHANWPSGAGYGGISRHVAVVDVSEANNWSAVRVELGRDGNFGSVYPTYGFIYKRPDTGLVAASYTPPAPLPDINPVPSDLRPVAERPWRMIEEVAESPSAAPRRIDFKARPAGAVR